MSQNKRNRNRGAVITHQRVVTAYQGPIPSAEQFARYAEIQSNFPDRILRMAESNSVHRQGLETAVVFGNVKAQARGQFFAFILALVAMCIGGLMLYQGKTEVGLWIMVSDVLALAGVFLGARWMQKNERADKRAQLGSGQH